MARGYAIRWVVTGLLWIGASSAFADTDAAQIERARTQALDDQYQKDIPGTEIEPTPATSNGSGSPSKDHPL
ncbi:MAG TPA: hypothetical protein VGC41_00470, partial [Kofleriaceae bacterium]